MYIWKVAPKSVTLQRKVAPKSVMISKKVAPKSVIIDYNKGFVYEYFCCHGVVTIRLVAIRG